MRCAALPRRARWAAPPVLAVLLAACSSSPAPTTKSSAASTTGGTTSASQLQTLDTTVLGNLTTYLSKVDACKSQSTPVVCIESADRTLGGQVHDYANKLASGASAGAAAADVTAARNAAQLLANSMEILGDAQPTQANYDQVLNTFNVNGAIASLQKAVAKVQSGRG